MGKPTKELEPGSLYVTVALPKPQLGSDERVDIPVRYDKPPVLCDVDIATYETHCTPDLCPEEFNWGLYFHRGRQDGVALNLKRGTHGFLSYLELDRRNTTASPRLDLRVVGLVRVLRVPDFLSDEILWYLDWLALESAGSTNRTFIWATSMYLRTWHHIVQNLGYHHLSYGLQFDVNLFLRESLLFSYGEVKFALGGQLPRPILRSAFGTEIGVGGKTLDSAPEKGMQGAAGIDASGNVGQP